MNSAIEGLYSGYNSMPSIGSLPGIGSLAWRQNKKSESVSFLANSEILTLVNALNRLNKNSSIGTKKIDLPRIVVVGTQSSGKSSILNGLLSMDLLPTGKQMVTRTPLHLQLHQCTDISKSRIEFYDGLKIDLTMPKPTPQEQEKVKLEIERQTGLLAGNQKAISDKPIHCSVYTPYVPNLSLFDLPGLTMVACTDKGQPKDIKEQIRKLVGNYINEKRTLILAVMTARADLEVDMALDLIKEHDPHFSRTLGVLTKLDLLDEQTLMSDYLSGNVSKDLQLAHGYFAVKNRTPTEMKTMDIHEGFQKEMDYFAKHVVYNQSSFINRLGMKNLGDSLSHLLIDHIRKSLPEVLTEIAAREKNIKEKLASMGGSIPTKDTDKLLLIQRLVFDFSQRMVRAVQERGDPEHIGWGIKESFNNMRSEYRNLDPLHSSGLTEEMIGEAVRKAEGYRMSFPLPPIEFMESVMNNTSIRPLQKFYKPAEDALKRVVRIYDRLISTILSTPEFSRFPKFCAVVRETIKVHFIDPAQNNCIVKVKEIIEMEENYIWSEDKIFQECLQGGRKMTSRNLLEQYFRTVRVTLENTIPKAIMLFFVKASVKSLSAVLIGNLSSQLDMLQENPHHEKIRKDLSTELEQIFEIRKTLLF